jgi:hypothetical protein
MNPVSNRACKDYEILEINYMTYLIPCAQKARKCGTFAWSHYCIRWSQKASRNFTKSALILYYCAEVSSCMRVLIGDAITERLGVAVTLEIWSYSELWADLYVFRHAFQLFDANIGIVSLKQTKPPQSKFKPIHNSPELFYSGRNGE